MNLNLFTQELQSSLQDHVSDDVFKYILKPYHSTLHSVFDIHIGHTTVYEIYKGKYYNELEQPGKEKNLSFDPFYFYENSFYYDIIKITLN